VVDCSRQAGRRRTRALPRPGTASEMRSGGGDLLTARETAASPRGGAQGWTPYLAPHPSGWHEGPAPRGDHRRARTTRVNQQDRHLGRHWAVGRRGTLRSLEKQRERSPLVNPNASTRWGRWRSAGRTSWPISRIL
jgi:hypothetical protein